MSGSPDRRAAASCDVGAAALTAQLPGGGRVLFTSRAEGNLSLQAGQGHEQGLERREALAARLGLRALCAGPQVHGSTVVPITELAVTGAQPLPDSADGRATALRGVGTMVLVADCLPVALGAHRGVAMVHAGWRGLAAGVLEEGVAAMREVGARAPITAVIGPCAGQCCYEVGEEVHERVGAGRLPAHAHRCGCNLDMRGIAAERLLQAGVATVRTLGGCTICDERFFSHRREGALAGRQAGVAWLA